MGIRYQNKALRVPALLDTGSHWTIFGIGFAEALGIDWKAAPRTTFFGFGNQPNSAYVVQVRLILVDASYGWDAKVLFSEAANRFSPVLGYIGFFEHFEVRFKGSQNHFRINLK